MSQLKKPKFFTEGGLSAGSAGFFCHQDTKTPKKDWYPRNVGNGNFLRTEFIKKSNLINKEKMIWKQQLLKKIY